MGTTSVGVAGAAQLLRPLALVFVVGCMGPCGEPPAASEATSQVLGELRFVPGGSFEMGCKPGRDDVAGDCMEGEVPLRRVRLTRGFWMMRTEVTQGTWRALAPANPSKFAGCGDGCPVESVNWWEALAFANLASEAEQLSACYELSDCDDRAVGAGFRCAAVRVATSTGSPIDCEGYRLPTEAEWERAARSDSDEVYAGGRDADAVSWHAGNSARSTHEACALTPNPYDLCDMSGNVSEWTWARGGTYDPDDVVDPLGPAVGTARVFRGGAWNREARVFARVAARNDAFLADADLPETGFRLVRSYR